ncbi:hypothetical protein [Pseudonocardia acidicola]|uniref:Allene oxide cyclase barrel-like domain-containing protein n=1 Tax=Pseudonocardia acidicola TaxID=2724939 RepID=A0ABX1SI15_9PSEU|nr:hypothetical protein [Pseudonocardia acidicola]NMI00129.1 hypothetical protein [Pseudonocardia acidicola]
MRRQTWQLRFEPQATAPTGEPPTFEVKSGPGTVVLLEGDGSGLPTEASYVTRVTMLDATALLEEGTMTLDGGTLRLSTIGTGIMEPAPVEGLLRGAVIWRVEGAGRFSGATGILASVFSTDPAKGTAVENQVAQLFLP